MATNEEFYYKNVSQGAYEGSTEHYRLEQQGLLQGDQDTLSGRELKNLWMRSHHAIRNNGLASAAKIAYRTHIGALKVVWTSKDGTPHKRMQALWKEFADNPSIDGYGNIYNKQDNWNSAMFESGEALERMIVKRRPDITVPLVLQQLESELLDPTWNPLTPENTKNSITFKNSKPSKYHFLKTMPGNYYYRTNFNQNERVSIDVKDMIHILERDRPGQWRGIPKMAPVLLSLYGLDDLTDATIAKQKAAQALTWIIRDNNITSATSRGTIGELTDTNTLDEFGERKKISQAEAGGTQYLNRGEEVFLSQGSDIGSSFEPLIKNEARKIVQAMGIPYEVVTGDMAGVSFSALKFMINELLLRTEFIRGYYIINLGLTPLCARFKELAMLTTTGLKSAIPTFESPRFYGVDRLKDTQADLLEIANGLSTLKKKQAERHTTFKEAAEDKKEREAAGFFIEPTAQSKNTEANSNSSEV